MKSTFTGIRDLDIEILNRLEDKDLISFCATDKYAKTICDSETFWSRRTIEKYGKYLSLDVMKKFKNNKTWAEYYIQIAKVLNSANPEYEAAKALKTKSFDIVELLKQLKQVHVEFIENVRDDTYESFYLTRREGDFNSKKQGKYVYETPFETEEGQYLNGLKVGKWLSFYRDGSYSINEYYDNGRIKSHELWHGNTLLEREYYKENGAPMLQNLWVKQYF